VRIERIAVLPVCLLIGSAVLLVAAAAGFLVDLRTGIAVGFGVPLVGAASILVAGRRGIGANGRVNVGLTYNCARLLVVAGFGVLVAAAVGLLGNSQSLAIAPLVVGSMSLALESLWAVSRLSRVDLLEPRRDR